MYSKKVLALAVVIVSLIGLTATPVAASGSRQKLLEVTVTVENLAPANGTVQTPVWVGVHDGSFDLYDRGEPASPALERIAEDGNIDPLFGAFDASGAGIDGAVFGNNGPLFPGDSGSVSLVIDAQRGSPMYLSYASMVIPSNDAFIANGNPMAIPVIDSDGRFVAQSFVVAGSAVLDAGTEVNDEIPEHTAFLAQSVPNTGDTENGVVGSHPGFMPDGNILQSFAGADFTADGYDMVRITTTAERVDRRATAKLTGDQEEPAVETDANGSGSLKIRKDGTIDFRVAVKKIDDVTGAHIHMGAPGANGPVVVNLLAIEDLEQSGPNRVMVRGTITDSDLTGPLAGMSTLDLWNAVNAGNTYFNVHTMPFPGGEVRGNIG